MELKILGVILIWEKIGDNTGDSREQKDFPNESAADKFIMENLWGKGYTWRFRYIK